MLKKGRLGLLTENYFFCIKNLYGKMYTQTDKRSTYRFISPDLQHIIILGGGFPVDRVVKVEDFLVVSLVSPVDQSTNLENKQQP